MTPPEQVLNQPAAKPENVIDSERPATVGALLLNELQKDSRATLAFIGNQINEAGRNTLVGRYLSQFDVQPNGDLIIKGCSNDPGYHVVSDRPSQNPSDMYIDKAGPSPNPNGIFVDKADPFSNSNDIPQGSGMDKRGEESVWHQFEGFDLTPKHSTAPPPIIPGDSFGKSMANDKPMLLDSHRPGEPSSVWDQFQAEDLDVKHLSPPADGRFLGQTDQLRGAGPSELMQFVPQTHNLAEPEVGRPFDEMNVWGKLEGTDVTLPMPPLSGAAKNPEDFAIYHDAIAPMKPSPPKR